MTITTIQIEDTEALLKARLNELQEVFEADERRRKDKREQIRDVAIELAENNGEDYKVGVDEILTTMGMERSDLYVSVFVANTYRQVVRDPHRLRTVERGNPPTVTDWRAGYEHTGLVGRATLTWQTQTSYRVFIEDTSIPSWADCYCDHIKATVQDVTDAEKHGGYVASCPEGAEMTESTVVGCSGTDCSNFQSWANATY